MQNGDAILVMVGVSTFVVALIAIVLSILAFNEGKKAAKYQILYNLASEYRSVEMLHAVRTLWDFYRRIKYNLRIIKTNDEDLKCCDLCAIKNKLREEYYRKKELDDIKIEESACNNRLEIERDSLHNQRRIVSNYYQFLATLFKIKAFKPKIIPDYWEERDLRIIPLILLSLEYGLQVENGNKDPKNHPALLRMKYIYENHPDAKSALMIDNPRPIE